MELSVVILNYNVRYFLEQCIRSVQEAVRNLDAEIIVIDNASSDDSGKMVQSLFPEVIYIQNSENVGFSKANNQAVNRAKGKYLCILNPDTAVAEDTFIKTLEFYKNMPKIGCLGVRLMDGTGCFLPESKRNLPTPQVSLQKLMGHGAKYYAGHVSEYENGKVAVLVGAFMLMKKEIYDAVGGFDEDYFMYGEDIDLSYKIEKAGFVNYYYGETTVLHYKGESTKRDEIYFDRFYGAMKIFYDKHFNKNILIEKMVDVGVSLAKWKNKKFKSDKVKPLPESKGYYLISNNIQLRKNLETLLNVKFKDFPESFETIRNSLIIFDAEYVKYSRILEIMSKLSGKNNRFRIRPKAANFIIGSDRSDEKGTVLTF